MGQEEPAERKAREIIDILQSNAWMESPEQKEQKGTLWYFSPQRAFIRKVQTLLSMYKRNHGK